jgi:Cytochrome P460
MSQPARLAVVAALALLAAPARPEDPAPVALPGNYRAWSHVRSMVVTDADEGMYGFHNVYANPAALKVLRSSKRPVAYPDGATFVVSIFEVRQEKGLVVAGAKQRDVVQVKDRKAQATGGWRYASFDPTGKPLAIDASSCAACHAQAAASDRVFTRFTE